MIATNNRSSALLALETAVVMAAVIAASRAATAIGCISGCQWWLVPSMLVAAALLPAWLGGRGFPRIGLDRSGIRTALIWVGCLSACALPLAFLGVWLLDCMGLPAPLRPAIGDWLSWSLYQFLYVAVAEEIFFRGYVQANAARALGRTWSAILASAACFALGHAAIQGQLVSFIVFLPGILLGWLFARTHALLAPILFHGLANVAYAVMAVMV